MKMLKIKADNMRDALAEARRMLGDEAVVLHTKQYEEPAVFGLCKKQGVEIIAAGESGVQTQIPPVDTLVAKPIAEQPRMNSVERNLDEIRQTLSELMSGLIVAQKRQCTPAVERLMRNGVSQSLAEATLAGCGDDLDQVLTSIGARIRCTGGVTCMGRQQRVAVVGPTGVGKTTTCAKLAAQYCIYQKKKVALITLDTYRVGAVEQLAAYSRIMDVPMEVAMSPEDGEALVAKHSDKDLIIIDTVGRSQRNREHISELGTLLRMCRPTEIHLAISSSADQSACREAMDAFRPLGIDRVILTKLDECSSPGCVLEFATFGMMPFSYVTCGQDVPDDIILADRHRLSRFVWESSL